MFPLWRIDELQNISPVASRYTTKCFLWCENKKTDIYSFYHQETCIFVRMLTVSTNRAGEQQGTRSDGDGRMCTALAGICKYIEFWFV